MKSTPHLFPNVIIIFIRMQVDQTNHIQTCKTIRATVTTKKGNKNNTIDDDDDKINKNIHKTVVLKTPAN